jgi:hypothetical protein
MRGKLHDGHNIFFDGMTGHAKDVSRGRKPEEKRRTPSIVDA